MGYSAGALPLAASPISTFVRHYVPCTQVDIGLAARVDTRPRTPSSVGFVYIYIYVYIYIDISIYIYIYNYIFIFIIS